MYKEIDGIAMGSPLGPEMANIFVGFHEQDLLAHIEIQCYYY